MRNQQAGRLFILGLFLLTGYLVYLVFKPFMTAFAWAAFLSIPFWPVYTRLVRILRGRATLAAIVTMLLITVLILVPVIVLVSSLTAAVLGYLPELERRIAGAPGAEGEGRSADAGAAEPAAAHAATPESARTEATTHRSAPAGGEPAGATTTHAATPGAAPAEGTASRTAPAQGAKEAESSTGAPSTAPRYRMPLLRTIEEKLSRYVDMSHVNLEAQVAVVMKRLGTIVVESSTAFLGNALNMLSTALMTMFMLVVFFIRGPALIEFLRKAMPLSETDQQAVFKETQNLTRAIFYGVIMTAAIQGLVGGIGWKIAGLPSAIIFGVAMFFCALLPFGGAALIWAPGAAWLFYQGHSGMGTFMVLWGILAVSMLDNVLRPIFISGKTKAPTIPVMLGILGGVGAFGMTGLIIGPLVVALFLIVLEVINRDFFGGENTEPPAPPDARQAG